MGWLDAPLDPLNARKIAGLVERRFGGRAVLSMAKSIGTAAPLRVKADA